jgi:hypothetical protein
MHGGKNHHENLKKMLVTLDIGSHSSSNATLQATAGSVRCAPAARRRLHALDND